jgi:hypothetical protein
MNICLFLLEMYKKDPLMWSKEEDELFIVIEKARSE